MYFIIGFKYILFVVLSQPKSKISATCSLNVKVLQSSFLDPLLFSRFSVPQVTSPNLVPPNVAFHIFICKPNFVTWCMAGISTFCLSGHVRIAMPTQKSWLVIPQLYPHPLPAFSPGNPRPHTLSSVNIFTWISRRQGFCPSIPCSLSFLDMFMWSFPFHCTFCFFLEAKDFSCQISQTDPWIFYLSCFPFWKS